MTTIIASKTEGAMAADMQCSYGELKHTAPKLFCWVDALYGASGATEDCELFRVWACGLEALYPKDAKQKPALGEDFAALCVCVDGLWRYGGKLVAITIEEPFWCIGSGREFATGALHMGATVQEAICLAAKLDVFTGEPVQVFHLADLEKLPHGEWLR